MVTLRGSVSRWLKKNFDCNTELREYEAGFKVIIFDKTKSLSMSLFVSANAVYDRIKTLLNFKIFLLVSVFDFVCIVFHYKRLECSYESAKQYRLYLKN